MAAIPGVTSPGEVSMPKENGKEQPKGGDNKTPGNCQVINNDEGFQDSFGIKPNRWSNIDSCC